MTVISEKAVGLEVVNNGGQPFVISINEGFKQYSISDITDGTSSTLAFSECIQGIRGISNNGIADVTDHRGFVFVAARCWFSTWLTPNSQTADMSPGSDLCCVSTEKAPCFSAGALGSDTCHVAARSLHPGGVNAAMLDGSVQFVVDSIEWRVWQAMGTSQGGETITVQ